MKRSHAALEDEANEPLAAASQSYATLEAEAASSTVPVDSPCHRLAEEEGLTLISSSRNATGWLNVTRYSTAKWRVDCSIRRCEKCFEHSHTDGALTIAGGIRAQSGNQRCIGTTCTAIEGALLYARHCGPERSRQEADACNRDVLSEGDVLQLAADEGLELVTSSRAASGFRGVLKSTNCVSKPYQAVAPRSTTRKYLGDYATAMEAALAYARHLGPEESHKEAARSHNEGDTCLSAEEVEQLVREENLTLVRAQVGRTGFKYVTHESWKLARYPNWTKPWKAEIHKLYLGNFACADAAALAVARHLGPERSAAEAKSVLEGVAKAASKAAATVAQRMAAEEAAKAKAAAKAAEKEAKAAEKVAKAAEKAAAKARLERELEERHRAAALQQRELLREAALQQQQQRTAQSVEQPSGKEQHGGTSRVLEADNVANTPIDKLIAMVLTGAKLGSHACLGVPMDAAHEACRKRYHALALRIHPDKTSSPGAAEAFQALKAAFHAVVD